MDHQQKSESVVAPDGSGDIGQDADRRSHPPSGRVANGSGWGPELSGSDKDPAQTRSTGPLAHPVWPIWLSYKRLFSTPTMMLTSGLTPGAMGWFGNDVVSGFRRNPSTAKAFALLDDLSPSLFQTLVGLAALNQRRQELGFQMLVVFYVTGPVTLFVSTGEIAPDQLKLFLRHLGDTFGWLVGVLVLTTLIYLASLWRARQMVQVLELFRLERGLDFVVSVPEVSPPSVQSS